MTDESDYARQYAVDVRVDPAVNGFANVQTFAESLASDSWIVSGVPTADPHVVGQIWANTGVLTISAG